MLAHHQPAPTVSPALSTGKELLAGYRLPHSALPQSMRERCQTPEGRAVRACKKQKGGGEGASAPGAADMVESTGSCRCGAVMASHVTPVTVVTP
ncbi:hypothetical protein THIX_30715 [Thiomonas sp. X19]|nr:hypothetical protein THIX_30715 [Thiomonas sp. X19]